MTDKARLFQEIAERIRLKYCGFRPVSYEITNAIEQAIELTVEATAQIFEEEIKKYPRSYPVATKPLIAARLHELAQEMRQ